MRDNFDRCLAITLVHEGGWADHPADPGGATMKGVTLATYRQYHPGATKAQLRAISDADLRRIYRDGYWDKVRGDDLPAGLDLIAFDGAVNSGPSRGARWLQSALGVTADGQIGPATIAAAKAADAQAVIRRALQDRLAFMRAAKNSKTGALLWTSFGKGWSRRVAEIEAAALAMVGDPPAATVGKSHNSGLLSAILSLITRIFGGAK